MFGSRAAFNEHLLKLDPRLLYARHPTDRSGVDVAIESQKTLQCYASSPPGKYHVDDSVAGRITAVYFAARSVQSALGHASRLGR